MLEGAGVGRDGLLLCLGQRAHAQLIFQRHQEEHRHRPPQRPIISFRKLTPPQNRQLMVSINNSEQYVDDFVGELTFQNQ